MRIVDTHVHVGRYWYEPVEVLLSQMERNGVEKAVLVQYGGDYDNAYLLECCQHFPGRFAPVAMVDVSEDEAAEVLADWARRGIVGVRLYAPRPSSGPEALAVWSRATELGLVVSCNGRVADFASDRFHELVASLPELTVVIEHLAGLPPGSEADGPLFRHALALAALPNTYLKLPGFGELFARPIPFRKPPFPEAPEAIRMAYDAFGPKRMMWGSDYPPVSGREGYANALRWPMQEIGFFTDEDRQWVFGQSALSVWRFV